MADIIISQRGVIAGIGDKSLSKNIILPEFDAKYRNFVVGKSSCILEGFDYKKGILYPTLTKGVCIAKGYLGAIENDVALAQANTQYVYGRFTVYHDENKVDTFDIMVTRTPLSSLKADDILNSAGTYEIQLYPRPKEKQYPYKAEYSDYTNVVKAGGSLENGVTAVTQDVDDNSDKVATDEFVHNAIEKGINYKEATLIYTYRSGSGDAELGKIYLQKKANFVVATSKCTGGKGGANPYYIKASSIPNEFLPLNQKSGYLVLPYVWYNGAISVMKWIGRIVIFKINQDGTCGSLENELDNGGILEAAITGYYESAEEVIAVLANMPIYSGWQTAP